MIQCKHMSDAETAVGDSGGVGTAGGRQGGRQRPASGSLSSLTLAGLHKAEEACLGGCLPRRGTE
jgi:hypothetical protein